jgi:hypothetical protein
LANTCVKWLLSNSQGFASGQINDDKYLADNKILLKGGVFIRGFTLSLRQKFASGAASVMAQMPLCVLGNL